MQVCGLEYGVYGCEVSMVSRLWCRLLFMGCKGFNV